MDRAQRVDFLAHGWRRTPGAKRVGALVVTGEDWSLLFFLYYQPDTAERMRPSRIRLWRDQETDSVSGGKRVALRVAWGHVLGSALPIRKAAAASRLARKVDGAKQRGEKETTAKRRMKDKGSNTK